MNMSIRARGTGLLSTPLHDQSMPVPGAMPTDRKVARRDNGNAEEPQPRERQYVPNMPVHRI
jgi:hypothetical protein